MLEYRVRWSATSDVGFRGSTDWVAWDDTEASSEQIHEELNRGGFQLPAGLELALEGSGFEWWVETREAAVSDG